MSKTHDKVVSAREFAERRLNGVGRFVERDFYPWHVGLYARRPVYWGFANGERTLMLKGQTLANNGAFVFGISPNGRNYVYWNEGKFQSYDLDAGTSKTLDGGAPSFVDTDFDHPGVRPLDRSHATTRCPATWRDARTGSRRARRSTTC